MTPEWGVGGGLWEGDSAVGRVRGQNALTLLALYRNGNNHYKIDHFSIKPGRKGFKRDLRHFDAACGSIILT